MPFEIMKNTSETNKYGLFLSLVLSGLKLQEACQYSSSLKTCLTTDYQKLTLFLTIFSHTYRTIRGDVGRLQGKLDKQTH